MYQPKNGVAQIYPDIYSLAVTLSVTSKNPECRSAPCSTGLEHYDAIFASSVATRIDQRIECFRIRFQVYCIDNDYEDPDDNPDGLETDAYDRHSAHSLLIHRSTGQAIGTVRLVLPHEGGERRLLPMQRIAGAADAVVPFPIARTAEISRFSIVKSFRQHTSDQGVEATLTPGEWRKMLFHLPLGLIRSCIEMSVREGITHCAATMEPALLRLLTRLGIHFNPLGPLVNYHGRRQPCWVDLEAMLRRTFDERPDVWEVITDGGRLWPLTETHRVAARRAMTG